MQSKLTHSDTSLPQTHVDINIPPHPPFCKPVDRPFQVFNDHNERRVILILDVPRSDLGPGRWFLRVLNHVFLWGVSPLLPESSNIVANTAEFRRLVDTLAANTK